MVNKTRTMTSKVILPVLQLEQNGKDAYHKAALLGAKQFQLQTIANQSASSSSCSTNQRVFHLATAPWPRFCSGPHLTAPNSPRSSSLPRGALGTGAELRRAEA